MGPGNEPISEVERAALADPAVRAAVAAAKTGDQSELRTRPLPDDLPLDQETLVVSYELAAKINAWHGEHEGQPLTLTPAEVCDLAGCALGGEFDSAYDPVDRWTRRLWETSQEGRMIISLAGQIQEVAGEMRAAAGLPELT